MDDTDKIKIAVVSFQQVPVGISPYLVLVGQHQTTNENNDFNARVMNACAKFVEKTLNSELLNYADIVPSCPASCCQVDGVSCDTEDVWLSLCKYLSSKKRYLAITDPNHNMKNV
eukprot:6878832-Ditylum_brightwellii.AAC.1